MIIKPLSEEVALSTTVGNNIALANIVRLINNSATAGTVTIQNNSGTYATVTIAANQELIIEKERTDTLLGSAITLRVVKIAYTN